MKVWIRPNQTVAYRTQEAPEYPLIPRRKSKEETLTLEQWAYLGQIAAAVAVIASLIYLGVQVRQSNVLSRAQTRQSMMELAQEQILIYVNDPELWACVFATGKLTDEQNVKAHMWLTASMRQREYEWLAHRDGVMDADMFAAYTSVIAFILGTERNRRWWETRKEIKEFDPGFMAYVDSLLAQSSLTNYSELIETWNSGT
jgi:hypothetical protein